MFGFKKKNEGELVNKYKEDNTKLMSRIAYLEAQLKDEKMLNKESTNKLRVFITEVANLKTELEELKSDKSQKVTYVKARKVMNKEKLRQMRAALEAVPSNANGFSGTVSVYDKKARSLSVVELKSRDQALEILRSAEKGHVDIVL